MSNTWLGDTSVDAETFILKAKTIVDIQEFGASHDAWLVSIEGNPQEAARWWHWQKDKSSEPGEGWVSLDLAGTELMPSSAWTNVEFFWFSVLAAIEAYLDTGQGHGSFSNEPAEFSIVKKGQVAVFTLRGAKYPVEPVSFLSSLLDGAKNFYTWADRHVGVFPASIQEKIDHLNDVLTSRSLS